MGDIYSGFLIKSIKCALAIDQQSTRDVSSAWGDILQLYLGICVVLKDV